MNDNPKDISEAIANGADINPETAEEHIKKTEPEPSYPSKPPEEGSLEGFVGYEPETEEREPFPLDALPDPVAEAVREFARVALAPESMAAVTAIGVISGAVGGGVSVETFAGRTTGPNLYLMLIAATGTGKDMVLGPILEPLVEKEAELAMQWDDETRNELAAELNWIKKRIAKVGSKSNPTEEERMDDREVLKDLEIQKWEIEKKLASKPAITVSDATREALAEVLAHQNGESVMSVSSEARGIMSNIKGRYTNGDFQDDDFYAGCFSGTRTKVTRKGKDDLLLARPCLSALWMVQPDAFEKFLGDATTVDSGLLPRFLIHDPHAEPELIPADYPCLDARVREVWKSLVEGLIDYRDTSNPVSVTVTADARKLLIDYDNSIREARRPGGEYRDVAPFAARWGEIAWRLALVIHLARYGKESHRHELDETSARGAIKIVRWFSKEALQILAANRDKQRRDRRDRLVKLLEDADGRSITLRDLNLRHNFKPEEVESLAASSGGRIAVDVRQNPKGGPRSRFATLKQ